MNQVLVPLKEIIPAANIEELKTLEEISQIDKSPEWYDSTSPWNWKPATPQFFTYSDYFLDAGQSFQGQIIVDLGCGLHLDNYELARIFEATAYIGVDKYNARDLFDKFQNQTKYEQKEGLKGLREAVSKLSGGLRKLERNKNTLRLRRNLERFLEGSLPNIPSTIVAEDMLDFLKRLPDGSVSVLTGRIDKCMIPETDDDYAQEIESEITRVIHPNGSHISYLSRFENPHIVQHKMDNSYTRFTKQ